MLLTNLKKWNQNLSLGSDANFLEVMTMAWQVIVDKDKCTGCGECVDVCPVSVYELKGGKSDPVNEDECIGCESCVEACPVEAITVKEA